MTTKTIAYTDVVNNITHYWVRGPHWTDEYILEMFKHLEATNRVPPYFIGDSPIVKCCILHGAK